MKATIIIVGLVITFMTTGCMSGYYARHDRQPAMERDTLSPPPMTLDDVIALAQDSVADDVILDQIKATSSRFRLTNNDIRDLKKNGVSSRVISAMIKTADGVQPNGARAATISRYSLYPDYYWYPSYFSPWYSPVYLGFSFRGGHYGGFHGGVGRIRLHR